MKKIVPLLFASLLALPSFAQKASPFSFGKDVHSVGNLEQGQKTHVVLHAKNTSPGPVALENVISQNSGPENFRFPKSIKPGQDFTVEYDLNTAYMEGPFTHSIVLIDTDGHTYVTYAEGSVKAPVLFSEKMLDLGYYAGGATEWTFYAWNPDSKALDLALSPESSKEFSASISPVRLDTRQFDAIKEGGQVPGLKITLKVKQLEKTGTKSIRKLVSFQSKAFPSATPEVLAVGYWKQ